MLQHNVLIVLQAYQAVLLVLVVMSVHNVERTIVFNLECKILFYFLLFI